jgi:hypothetical protein
MNMRRSAELAAVVFEKNKKKEVSTLKLVRKN